MEIACTLQQQKINISGNFIGLSDGWMVGDPNFCFEITDFFTVCSILN